MVSAAHCLTPLALILSALPGPTPPDGDPKMQSEITLCGLAVADRNKDHVAFVSLDIFKVLDEERLARLASKEAFGVGICAAEKLKLLENRLTLGNRKGRDAQRLFRICSSVANDRLGYRLCLLWVRSGGATIIGGFLQMAELQSHAGDGIIGTGHDEELVLVELAV